ncbi:MAG: response regulator [Anaerolineae bacterium]|nr:response regulator [Anaerolineae bacterium]
MNAQASFQGEPLLILLVEDNAAHARLVMRSLADHQIANRVVHLSDGEAALNYLFRQGDYADPETSPRPHLVLLDLRLPRVDGLSVLQRIKNSPLQPLPVVVLTTSETESDAMAAYHNQANSYLVKPLNFEKFSAMLQQLGFYWLAWNRYPWTHTEP